MPLLPRGRGPDPPAQLKYSGNDWAALILFLVITVAVGVLGRIGL